MLIQLSLSLHCYILYLLLNSCGGNDEIRVFLGGLLVALKRLRKEPVAYRAGSEKSRFKFSRGSK